jgi:hypothetical protein
MVISPIGKMVNAMATIQSDLSPIEAAARAQNRVFVLYVLALVFGALLTAGLTVWLWRATNKYQDVVTRDADARIQEASAKASQADVTAKQLEHDNLALRGSVANLETQAAEARTKQAQAEASLYELQRQRLPRMLRFDSQESLNAMIESLRQNPLTTEIVYKRDDSEAYSLAYQIWAVLSSAGWHVSKPAPISQDIPADKILEDLGAQPLGVSIAIKAIPNNPKPNDPYSVLTGALAKTLGQISVGRAPSLPDNVVRIIVMPKP